VIASALAVLAQNASDYEGFRPGGPVDHFRFSLGGGYRSDADIDSGGKFNESELRAVGTGLWGLSDQLKLATTLSYQFSHYDFSGVAVSPWDDVHVVRATPLLYYILDEHWRVYGGPSFGFSAADGADWSQAFTGGGLAGFSYRFNQTLTLGAGLGVFSQIEDHARVLPIATANWQFSEQWNLRVGFLPLAGGGGLGAEVTYDLAKDWKIGAGVQFEQKRFRLDQNGPYPDGVGQDRRVPIYAKVTWELAPGAALEGVAGVVVGGQLQIDDSNGNQIFESNYKPSALVGLRAVYRF